MQYWMLPGEGGTYAPITPNFLSNFGRDSFWRTTFHIITTKMMTDDVKSGLVINPSI